MDTPWLLVVWVLVMGPVFFLQVYKELYTLRRNAKLKLSIRKLGKEIKAQIPLDEDGWKKVYNCRLATVSCRLDISAIKKIGAALETPFFEKDGCSAISGDLFFIAARFKGSVLLHIKRGPSLLGAQERKGMLKLYSACLLVCKETPDTVTFYSTPPEDADHEFYFRDLIQRFKELIGRPA